MAHQNERVTGESANGAVVNHRSNQEKRK